MIRTMTALLLAVVLAAALVGVPPAIQAQTPQTAAPAKAPKEEKTWPFDAETLKARRLEAEALPLFSSLDPIDVTITADFKTVQRDRNPDSTKTYPGTIAILTGGALGPAIPIQLRTRGHVRRSPRTCGFAPLRIEFTKGQMKGTVFQGQGAVKLGTHCQDDGIYQQYQLKEYLANRIYAALTPRSFRSRLAHVTYVDSVGGKKPFTKLGIFYEDDSDVAKRMEARNETRQNLLFRDLDQPTLTFMSLFQYMIGNTDYSIIKLHNIRLLADVDRRIYPVPYDFDYSGLVYAHYAVAAKVLGLASVRDRMYRGPCKTEADLLPALEQFRAKQDEILALPGAMPGLEEGPRKSSEKYLSEFFDLISRPDKVTRTFVKECNALAGM